MNKARTRCRVAQCMLAIILMLQAVVYAIAATGDGVSGAEVPHLAELGSRHLAVRTSTIPGAGLGSFALRRFAAGEHTEQYRCDVVPRVALYDKALVDTNGESGKTSTRAWTVNATHDCDGGGARFRLHNPVLYINSVSTKDTCLRKNVMESIRDDGYITYVALRVIDVGEELLISYGHNYFRHSNYTRY